MDRKAVPAELAVVLVELEGLLGFGQGLEADVAIAVFAGFAIALEVDGAHVLEQILFQVLLGFA